jgi:catechol 2,3-dioxygenase-like lactoylglutathione lyase family enzyme
MVSPHLYPITKALGYVSLGVSNLEVATETAEQVLGLRRVHSEADRTFFSSNDRAFELILSSASKPALQAVGLEATNEDSFGLLKRRLTEANVKFSEERDVYPAVGKLIRFLLPSGHPIELHSSVGETSQSFYPTVGVRPRRLGHALLKVDDIPKIEDFLTEILSFRVSDRGVGGEIVWFRCSEIHHSINLLHGPPGLHHYAWEVDDWSAFKHLGDVLRGHQSQLVWGPGRHGPGNNLFTYHADSTGALVEYFADILRIENEESYQWRDWSEVPEWNNVWGPLPPANFREYGVGLAP